MEQEIQYQRPMLYPFQKAIVDSPARFTVTEAATKVGKSASHLVWLFEQPLALKLTAGKCVWWVAPVYGQAEIMFKRLKNQLTAQSFLQFNESKLTATFPNRAFIGFKSADNPDNLYGEDVYAAVFDEFTRSKEEAWFALRSTLTATGGKCKFIGNVKGRRNWGYRLAQRAKAGLDPAYAYFKITAYDAAEAGMLTKDGRPWIDEIKEAKRDLPESVFKELYEAEASEDGSNPFGISHIQRCIYPKAETKAVCFGIDLAKKQDWTVIVGLDKFGSICHFDRFQLDWKQTTERILSLPPGKLCIDSTGAGDPIGEEIARYRDAELVVYTNRVKQQLMEGLASAIQKRQTTVLEGVMRNELESFEFEYSRNGVKYTAPSGMHDDCVNALALANKILPIESTSGEISVY